MSTRLDRHITLKCPSRASRIGLAALAAAAWPGVAPAVVASEPPDGGKRPDIIFILIDTLRADHLDRKSVV